VIDKRSNVVAEVGVAVVEVVAVVVVEEAAEVAEGGECTRL